MPHARSTSPRRSTTSNDAPHIGHAYTTVAADALARWRRLWGDDVVFLTGTDEHGTQDPAGRRGAGHHAPGDGRPHERAVPGARADCLDITNDDFIRTTEPRHCGRCRSSSRASTTTATSSSAPTRASTASPARPTTPRTSSSTATARSTARPVERVTEENYFFKLSRYEHRLLDHYAAHPEAVQPASKRNEVLGFIKQGLADFSISRTSISWGIPLPWDPTRRAYVWFDALINYCTAVGYGTDRERFDRYWPADYHLIGKDILRFHAVYWPAMLMAAGLAAAEARVRARLPARRRREDEQDARSTRSRPPSSSTSSASTASATTSSRDQHFGPDGDFSYEAMVARYNADLANNFGNLANRVLNMAVNYCDGVVPDTRADGPLVDAAATAFDALTDGMDELDYSNGFGAVWDLIRATNSYIEDRSRGRSTRRVTRPRPRRCSATASRRCASSRCSRRR